MTYTIKRSVLILALFAVGLTAVGCRTVKLVNPPPIEISTPTAETRGAIVRAMGQRHWTLQSENPGEIVAQILVRGKHRAVIGITYDPQQVAFRYIDSENLKYKKEWGKESIHKNYQAWVTNLRNNIAGELTKIQGH